MKRHTGRFEPADLLREFMPSGIRGMFSLARGIPDVISLGIGEPDSAPMPHVLDAAEQAMDGGKTYYAPTLGIRELLEALARKAQKDYGLSHDPNTEILVTVGARMPSSWRCRL